MKKLLSLLFCVLVAVSGIAQDRSLTVPNLVLQPHERIYYPVWDENEHQGDRRQPPTGQPSENRSTEYKKWLKHSVRIKNGSWFGSGTVCYYDAKTKKAYVITCGHLFRSLGDTTVQVHAFYKNDEKLNKYASYPASMLLWNKQLDIALITFNPDWEMDSYAPIGPADYRMDSSKTYYSCGCDEAEEVACYLMKYSGMDGDRRGQNLVMVQNAPREGRSGGGLMDAEMNYVGICWGSTNPKGIGKGGKGMFVPLSTIHTYFKENNYDWLLQVPKPNDILAHKLPIIDRTGPQRDYPKNYIPLPPW